MSYTILYRAMFIRTKDEKFIPFIESGDNNVYDCATGKRSRSWESCRWGFESADKKNEYALTEQEIMASAQQVIDDAVESYADKQRPYEDKILTKEEVLNNLGCYTCIKINGHSNWGNAKQFLAFFKSGFRNAVTFDDLRGSIQLSWWDDKGRSSDYANSEEELAQKYAKYRSEGKTVYVTLGSYNAETMWEEMKERKPKVERKRATESFVVAFNYCGSDRYLIQMTSKKVTFNLWPNNAHKYSSRKVAQATADKIARRCSSLSNVRVELATA